MTAPRGPRGALWQPQVGWLLSAVVAVAGGVAAWFLWPVPRPVADAVPAAAAIAASQVIAPLPPPVFASRASAPQAMSSAAPPPVARAPETDGRDLTPDISVFVNKGERPSMAEVIERLHAAGERGGLGAFPPPGTRPPLVGLAVPEDFVLPAGYVRHYQATDDGQRIEAVLMFAPDAQLFDAAQRPIPLPPDRVVPPELAPPGLPIRRIVIPPPAAEPGR